MADATPNLTTPAAAPEAVKAVQMELSRHYVPLNLIRIVGHQKPAITQKNAAGQMVELEPAKWMDGEMFPAPYPGAGFPNKIWAGTVIEVPEAEAKTMRSKKIAEAYL